MSKKVALKTVKPEAYAHGLQPSMSSSNILIECSYPYSKDVHRGAGTPARYGSALHELLAAKITHALRARRGMQGLLRPLVADVAKRWGVSDMAEELSEHVPAAHAELVRWLSKNEYKIDFDPIFSGGTLLIEQAVALKPLESGRALPPHDEDHRYHGLELGEQPGTLDLAIVPHEDDAKTPVLVLDHKTGEEDFSRPLDKPQLLSLAAGVMRWVGASEAVVGVLHARRRGMPKVYTEKVKLRELRAYEGRVKTALARIDDGSMRPGPWCAYCPAKPVCPAQDAELLSKAGDMLTSLTAAGGALSKEGLTANDVALAKVTPGKLSREKQLGHLYDVIRFGEALARRGRDEIKKEILESKGALLPETSKGEYLTVREYEKENLSKEGILKAYGKLTGEKMLSKLRADGAISKTLVQALYPEKERGR